MTIHQIQRPQLRAIQYFFVDGTMEFGFGLLNLILASFFFFQSRIHGWQLAVLDAFLILVLLGGAWLVKLLTRMIKENITYPRTGYIAYPPKRGWRRWIQIALGMAIGASTAVLAITLATAPGIQISTMPILSGFGIGLALAVMGKRARLPRFYFLAGTSAFTGLSLAWSRLGNDPALCAYYLTLGLVMIASGAITFSSYLNSSRSGQSE